MLEPEQILRSYTDREELLQQLRDALESETQDALNDLPHIDRICFRVKDPDRFAEKALDPENDPPYADPLAEIEDQVAGRIIVFFLADVNQVHGRLDGTFNTVERAHRKPPRDAEFGYESHHLICQIPPHLKPKGWGKVDSMPETFELQVRTIFMHAYAEPQHDFGYKGAQELTADTRKELAWIAASAWGADQAYQRVRDQIVEIPISAAQAGHNGD